MQDQLKQNDENDKIRATQIESIQNQLNAVQGHGNSQISRGMSFVSILSLIIALCSLYFSWRQNENDKQQSQEIVAVKDSLSTELKEIKANTAPIREIAGAFKTAELSKLVKEQIGEKKLSTTQDIVDILAKVGPRVTKEESAEEIRSIYKKLSIVIFYLSNSTKSKAESEKITKVLTAKKFTVRGQIAKSRTTFNNGKVKHELRYLTEKNFVEAQKLSGILQKYTNIEFKMPKPAIDKPDAINNLEIWIKS